MIMIPNIKKGANSFIIKATSCEFEVGSGFISSGFIRLDNIFYKFCGYLNRVYEEGDCFILEFKLEDLDDLKSKFRISKRELFCKNPKHYLHEVAIKITAMIMELKDIELIRRIIS